MAQITTGIRSILSHPAMYNLSQNLLGVRKARHVLANDYFPKKERLRVLDIGCGTAEILEFLPTSIDYVGFDASDAYIAEAKKTYGERGSFFADTVRDAHLNSMQGFDVVLAFGVVHHLDDGEAKQLFSMAYQALNDGGSLFTVDPCFCPGQPWLGHWLIAHDRGQNVRDEQGYQQLGKAYFGNVTSTPRHDFLRVPYTYLVMECKKAADGNADKETR